MFEWILFFAIVSAITSLVCMCLLIWHLFFKEPDDAVADDDEQIEPAGGGIKLVPRVPRPKVRTRRFTDRSRDWIAAHETESRR